MRQLITRKQRRYSLYFEISDNKGVVVLGGKVDNEYCGGLNSFEYAVKLWYINDVYYKMHKDYAQYLPNFDKEYNLHIFQKSAIKDVNYIYVG